MKNICGLSLALSLCVTNGILCSAAQSSSSPQQEVLTATNATIQIVSLLQQFPNQEDRAAILKDATQRAVPKSRAVLESCLMEAPPYGETNRPVRTLAKKDSLFARHMNPWTVGTATGMLLTGGAFWCGLIKRAK